MRVTLTLDRDADLSESNDYLRSLIEAGVPRDAIAIATPLAPDVGAFDALLLGGGVDVDPSRYGRQRLENGTVEVDAERDALDFRLFGQARSGGLPVLGICRGLQVVNVAMGGTLVQDIPSERPSPVLHQRRRAEKTRLDHRVAFTPGTELSRIAGAPDAAVNSRHHQAIEEVAAALTVSAVAPDGVPEAVEAAGDPWLVAVQWHPENLAGDALSRSLFLEFVRRARNRAGAPDRPRF
jgi:putative glutamine amidotransferase